MRVRITRMRPGEMDGISFGVFQVGLTYDVSSSLATYLIALDCADPVMDEGPVLVSTAELNADAEIVAVNQDQPVDVAADVGLPDDFRLQVPPPARSRRK